MKKSYLLFVGLLFWGTWLSAQEIDYSPYFGARVGLTFNLGNHFQRIGIQASAFHSRDQFQINTQIRLYYNFKSLGPPESRPELQMSTGLVFAYGLRDSTNNPFFHPVSNQTGRRNSIAYAYHWYIEKLTPQRTGTLALQFGKIELITENDALAGEGQDKYRTGGLQIAYRWSNPFSIASRIALNTRLWTGNTHGDKVARVRETGDYPCRFGYKNISQAHCGRYSHGILALQYQQYLGYGQQAGASIGFDSEKVRHFFQNRLIHDMPYLPASWVKTHNPHYPMLDKDGEPYLFQENQELRPLRFFFDLHANAPLFY